MGDRLFLQELSKCSQKKYFRETTWQLTGGWNMTGSRSDPGACPWGAAPRDLRANITLSVYSGFPHWNCQGSSFVSEGKTCGVGRWSLHTSSCLKSRRRGMQSNPCPAWTSSVTWAFCGAWPHDHYFLGNLVPLRWGPFICVRPCVVFGHGDMPGWHHCAHIYSKM